MHLIVGAESECGGRLVISEHGSIVLLNIDGAGRVEGHRLAMETISMVRESEVLFYRAEAVQDKMRVHVEFAKEAGWDYVSDEEDDIRLIKNSSTADLDIAAVGYDISFSRLKVRKRLGPFLGDPASEMYDATLHNYIRDAPGCRYRDRIDEVYLSTERMCWLCLFAEQESDNESASRELLTGQRVPMSLTGTILNSPRKIAARAAVKARVEAKSMSRRQGNCHMRCQLLKASL